MQHKLYSFVCFHFSEFSTNKFSTYVKGCDFLFHENKCIIYDNKNINFHNFNL